MLAEMVRLRKLGWSSPAIGNKFGLDHSTVLYHLRRVRDPSLVKYSTVGVVHTVILTRAKPPPKPRPLEHPFLESERTKKINPGKNYAEYLKKEKDKETDLTKWLTSRKK